MLYCYYIVAFVGFLICFQSARKEYKRWMKNEWEFEPDWIYFIRLDLSVMVPIAVFICDKFIF